MKLTNSLRYVLLLIILVSCSQNGEVNKWGLESLELEEKLILRNEIQNYDFEIIPSESSNKIEVSLYFTSLWYTSNDIKIGEREDLRDEILKSLEGLELSIQDKDNNEVLLDYEITYFEDLEKRNLRKYEFATNKILSLFIDSGLALEKNRKLGIQVSVPAYTQESPIKDFTLVIGKSRKLYP